MNLSVVIPIEVLPCNNACKLFILVGQRTTNNREKGSGQVVFVVFDAIPCVDTDVVAEQSECLEHILPCGIGLIGFLLCASGGADSEGLRCALRGHPLEAKLFTATRRDGQVTECRLLKTNSSIPFTTSLGKPPFCTLACCLRAPLVSMPLLVRSPEKNAADVAIIDLNGSTEIKGDSMLLAGESFCAMQLGSSAENTNSVLIWLHVTVALGYACGRDIYDAIHAFVPRLEPHPEGQITYLQSQRNSALVFQWVYTPADGGKTGLLKTQWGELRDLIEDGTGEKVKLSQVVSYTSGPNLSPEGAISKAGAKPREATVEKNQNPTMESNKVEEKAHVQKNLMRRWLPAAIAALAAILLSFLWTLLSE